MIRVRNRQRDAPPDGAADGQIDAGLDAIRKQFHVPGAFPADVVHAARRRRVDRTAWEFRTLDPASSTDLDQAFFIDTGRATVADADIVLHYAIADVGFFVHDGDPIDTEAVLLHDRIGEVFDGVIVDEDRHGSVMQLIEPAVLTRIRVSHVTPGDDVRAKLVSADPTTRTIEFARVASHASVRTFTPEPSRT